MARVSVDRPFRWILLTIQQQLQEELLALHCHAFNPTFLLSPTVLIQVVVAQDFVAAIVHVDPVVRILEEIHVPRGTLASSHSQGCNS